ncbi:MAG TPA: exodeoxyribonuclease VII small subunit [Candidatus Saccharimonadales bacterium]|nr:exodeoxyribonuclease VII small subunit [Candidatus Saccharimonadales bacterium]
MKERQPQAPGESFETMMKRLEELVHKMERGDLSLDESIRSFEEGIRLVKQCTSVLGEAEKRIQRLTEQGVVADTETKTEGERGDDELPF